VTRDREGDHNGRFTLPDGRRAHGTLSLESNTAPRVSLHPDTPTPIGPEGRGFPIDTASEQLVGQLYSNDEVVIGDVHLSEWFPNQFYASGRWALLGLSITRVPEGRWNSLEVRVTGLECLLGNAISATWWPKSSDTSPLRFSADLNADAEFVSTVDGVTLTAKYDATFSPADPYRFNLSNYATASFAAATPLTVDEWARGWINPLVGLLTLATGAQEEINTVTFVAPEPSRNETGPVSAEIKAQLFGGGIHQRDQPAERRTRPDGAPLVPLFTLDDAPPLAALIRTWQTNLADETATSLYRLAIDPTLPTHVRYLLCAQAIEALDTTSHSTEEEADDAAHAERRAAAVSALDDVTGEYLDATTKRFIRVNLARRPYRSLAGRLHRLIGEVPSFELRTQDWTKRTEELAAELEKLGRVSNPLHERLASTRNALSHGATLPATAVGPATRILQTLVRGQLVARLGFVQDQLAVAYDRMTRDP
jgi:ApeA N-terminal domain 1